jgi:hypothetical protein
MGKVVITTGSNCNLSAYQEIGYAGKNLKKVKVPKHGGEESFTELNQ